MKRDKETYLFDLKESCEHINEFIGSMSVIEYKINLLTRRAVEREFEIIGEVLKRVRDEFPELYDQIPDARQIIAFRNIIAHGYDFVSDDLVYKIVKEDIPKLQKLLEEL